MIKIESASGKGITGGVGGLSPTLQKVDILADTEAEILALGDVVTDMYNNTVIPAPGSQAHTTGYKAIYELSPSGVWVKM